jgi:CO dehydrogenase maturation factor
VEQTLLETERFDLLTMGRPEGPHCYCYVNNLLRTYLDGISKRYPFVVLDNEAGMEHLSRRTTNKVDALLLVAWPNAVSARAASRIAVLAGELPVKIGRTLLLANGLKDGETLPECLKESALELAGTVPFDEQLDKFVSEERSVFDLKKGSPALDEVSSIVDTVLKAAGVSAAS